MAYNAPTSPNFLKNKLGTDSSVVRSELNKIATETSNIRQLIGSGAGYADEIYIGDPALEGSWKITSIVDIDHTEFKIYRKSAAGDVSANWVQFSSLPRECGELIRYNGSTLFTLTEASVWYTSLNLTQGYSQEIDFVEGVGGDNYLMVSEAHKGVYRVSWVTSLAGTTGKTFEMGIMVNDVIQTSSISRKKMGAADVGPLSGTCILVLEALDEIRIATRCLDAAGQTVTFVHSNINMVRL